MENLSENREGLHMLSLSVRSDDCDRGVKNNPNSSSKNSSHDHHVPGRGCVPATVRRTFVVLPRSSDQRGENLHHVYFDREPEGPERLGDLPRDTQQVEPNATDIQTRWTPELRS